MRKIRFRGKTKSTGRWAYGFYCQADGHHCIILDDATLAETEYTDPAIESFVEVDPYTVGQHTGEHDRDGTPIWEDTLLQRQDIIGEAGKADRNLIGRVKMYNAMWVVSFGDRGIVELTFEHDQCLVIGNAHDNPEVKEAEHGEEKT